MTITEAEAPAPTQLVQSASSLAPLLKSHVQWSEENRRLHDETVAALREAGIFRMRMPARYGGHESTARTVVDVLAEIARADASAAWVAGVNAITMWMTGLLPDEVQDEVFGSPDAHVCGTLSPTAMGVPADGGLILNGQWKFISGAQHSTWQVVIAVAPAPDGSFWPVMGVVPLSDLRILDDWNTSGLRGTGSVTTIAQGVFVPERRMLPLPLVLGQQYASAANAESPVWRAPLLPTASALSVGVAVGLAAAAKEDFFERLPGRKITYTGYENQYDAPITHLQVAEAAMKVDEAFFHAHRLADLVDGKGADGSPWSIDERVFARAEMGRACRLAKEAVDIYSQASGGSSIYSHVPIQRIARDSNAIVMHALMNPDTNAELYGRILCGQEPNTLYV